MTDHKNDTDNDSTSEIPSRPEGQDTSETMTDKNPQETETTKVLPAAETPPTQQIAQQTQQIPTGSAPDGEVHPAYGAAAARVEAEAEAATPDVQDAPATDDSDPLAPLREPAPQHDPQHDPAPETSSTPVATDPAPASDERLTQPVTPVQPTPAPRPVPTQPSVPTPQQPAQPDAAAGRQRARVGTAVWGLIVIAVGLGVLAVAAGVVFDPGAALIVLLGAAGVILVVGSVFSSLRRR